MSLTGSDPKNRPWSYHNGGNWPMLLWVLVPAAMKVGRRDLAERVFSTAAERLHLDDWPEYYDTRSGRFIGQRANLKQVWSAAALLFAQEALYGWPQPFLFPTAVGPRMRPSLAA